MAGLVRTLAGILLAALALAATAATMADRSPFTQGHWWDRTRPGSGFDIFSVGDQGALVWYTYDGSGKPIWYTAQGSLSDGSPWPLLRHRWANGQRAEPAQVGTMSLAVESEFRIVASFVFPNGSFPYTGAIPLAPFGAGTTIPAVDRSGSWFAPANSGWGLTITDQGDVLGAVLYTYDPAGEPTWAAGFGREPASVELFTFTGACPTCTYRSPSPGTSVGRVDFSYTADYALRLAPRLSLPMAAGLRLDGAAMNQLSRPASSRVADRIAASFDSPERLKRYLVAGTDNPYYAPIDISPIPPTVGPYFGSGFGRAQGTAEKLDVLAATTSRAYALGKSNGAPAPHIRIAEVIRGGTDLQVNGTAGFTVAGPTAVAFGALAAWQDRVAVVAGTAANYFVLPGYRGLWTGGRTTVEVFGESGPSLASRWRAELEGHPVAAFRIDSRLYVVTRFLPVLSGFSYSVGGPAERQRLASTPLSAFLPKVRVNGGDPSELLVPATIHAPPQSGNGSSTSNLVTITQVDLDGLRVAGSIAFAATADAVYVSGENLYLAASRASIWRGPSGDLVFDEGPPFSMNVYKVVLAAPGMAVVGSQVVEGDVVAQDQAAAAFRFGETDGALRVLVSESRWQGTRNRLDVLAPSVVVPGLLERRALIPNAGRPDPIGSAIENAVVATRVEGDRGYLSTSSQLFVLDLSVVNDPRVGGSLAIDGSAAYLHSLAGRKMVAIGNEPLKSGSSSGGRLKAWLVDAGNANAPSLLSSVAVGDSDSAGSRLRTPQSLLQVSQAADGATFLALPARVQGLEVPGRFDSGLVRFVASGNTLAQGPSLISQRGSSADTFQFPTTTGRSRLLANGATVYMLESGFWFQDAAGNVKGPY